MDISVVYKSVLSTVISGINFIGLHLENIHGGSEHEIPKFWGGNNMYIYACATAYCLHRYAMTNCPGEQMPFSPPQMKPCISNMLVVYVCGDQGVYT